MEDLRVKPMGLSLPPTMGSPTPSPDPVVAVSAAESDSVSDKYGLGFAGKVQMGPQAVHWPAW